MELQVRISYGTAEMLELLKASYEKSSGVKFTKGEVLSKAILDTYDVWQETEWHKILNVQINFDEEYKITPGAQRPKFQIANSIEPKIEELKGIIKKSVDAKYVTSGAAIKFVLKLAAYQIQNKNSISTESIIFKVLSEFKQKEISTETEAILETFVNELMVKLEVNDLLQ